MTSTPGISPVTVLVDEVSAWPLRVNAASVPGFCAAVSPSRNGAPAGSTGLMVKPVSAPVVAELTCIA